MNQKLQINNLDPYKWLEDKTDPKTISYIKTEQKKTQDYINRNSTTINQLFQEAISKIKLADSSVPCRYHDYYYYESIGEKDNYAIHYRKKNLSTDTAELLINENELAQDHNFFDLDSAEISPDGRYLICAIDTSGDEYYELTIKDCLKNKWLTDTIKKVCSDVCWTADSQSFFYICMDDQHRPYQIKHHFLGTPISNDAIIYTEDDPKFTVTIELSKTEKYLFITCSSNITTEIFYSPSSAKALSFSSLSPRQQNIKYYAEEHDNTFYLLTNKDSKNYSLYTAKISSNHQLIWQILIPSHKEISLEGFELFQDFLVITQRQQATVNFQVYFLNDLDNYYIIDFPEEVFSIESIDNLEANSNILRYQYESLTQAPSVWDIDLKTKQKTLLKQEEVLGNYNPEDYLAKRVLVTAEDGTLIPLSLVYKKTMFNNKPNPLYLYGYGAYGYSNDPSFSYTRISLLDRGVIYAIAHIRGGGDCGEFWHDAGKMEHKQNSFSDFAACANYLIKNQYTTSKQLILSGGSAGGLLIGATLNQYPNLCSLAILNVPFVDVLNTMQNKELPLTIGEFEEWGNPDIAQEKEHIKNYSPYDNIESQEYPDCFITCGLEDYRVSYWEPLKWSGRIKEHAINNPYVLIKINNNAGHAGDSGRFQHIKDISLEITFILDRLNIKTM